MVLLRCGCGCKWMDGWMHARAGMGVPGVERGRGRAYVCACMRKGRWVGGRAWDCGYGVCLWHVAMPGACVRPRACYQFEHVLVTIGKWKSVWG